MDDSPHYEIYSLEQLYDVRRHINKEKYPERFALLVQAIQKKETEQISAPPPNSNVELLPVGPTAPSQPMGCVGGGLCVCAAIIVGATAGLLWMMCFVRPAIVPNTDGLNRWGGHIGAAMIGMLIGGIGGIFVAAGTKPLKTIAITTVVFIAVMLLLSNLG